MMSVNRLTKILGFSYVELVFTIAIMAVLAVVAVPYLENNVQRKKEIELRQSLREIRTAIDAYKDAYDKGKLMRKVGDSGYPPSLQILLEGVEDITDPKKRKLRFLRRIPADPMFIGLELDGTNEPISPADTWRQRSYDSEADDPEAGLDVFDVYSSSELIGLNGIPYAKW